MKAHQHTRMMVSLVAMFIIFMQCHAVTTGQQYTLVHDLSELSEGDEIIIVNPHFKQTVGAYYQKGKTMRFNDAGITIEEETATIADTSTTAFIYTTEERTVSGKKQLFTYLKTADTDEYLLSPTDGSHTALKSTTLTPATRNNANFSIDFSKDDFTATIKVAAKTLYFCVNYTNGDYCIWYFDNAPGSGDYSYRIYKKASGSTPTHLTINGIEKSANNTAVLQPYDGKEVSSITLQRAFAADGGWYTLCLPFALTANEIVTQFKSALFNEFSGVEVAEDGIAHLKFRKVTETKAGVPYMVLPKETVESPVFYNKTIDATTHTTTHTCVVNGTTLAYNFIGVFDPTPVSNSNIRFVGGDKGTELLIPDGTGTINGMRAYFLFPNNTQGIITHSKLNVDDGSATGIHSANTSNGDEDKAPTRCYTLSGQPMPLSQEKPSIPGIYIINGQKIVIRK